MASASTKNATDPFSKLSTRLLAIFAAFLVVGTVVIFATTLFGLVEFRLSMLAFVVCVISSLVAHVVGEYPSGDDYFAARLGGSIFARTCLPFLIVICAKLSPIIPFQPGFVLLVILFYLVGLVADVVLQASRLKTAE